MGITLFTCKAEVVEGMVPKLSLPQNLEMFKYETSEKNQMTFRLCADFQKKYLSFPLMFSLNSLN